MNPNGMMMICACDLDDGARARIKRGLGLARKFTVAHCGALVLHHKETNEPFLAIASGKWDVISVGCEEPEEEPKRPEPLKARDVVGWPP